MNVILVLSIVLIIIIIWEGSRGDIQKMCVATVCLFILSFVPTNTIMGGGEKTSRRKAAPRT